MRTTTGLDDRFLNSRMSRYIMSLAVTVPPGELMRTITPLTFGSSSARRSASEKRATGFSMRPSTRPRSASMINPLTSMSAIFGELDPAVGSLITSVSVSASSAGTASTTKRHRVQPLERATTRTTSRVR